MLLAVDVDYRETGAQAAGVAFAHWADATPARIYHGRIARVDAYEAGNFYRRELPCILRLLEHHRLNPEVVVIDGYVVLGNPARPGLGLHLYRALGRTAAVIGVAKTRFAGTPESAELYRGASRRPLFITSAGIDLETARRDIASMHGCHRIPELLRLADRESRKT